MRRAKATWLWYYHMAPCQHIKHLLHPWNSDTHYTHTTAHFRFTYDTPTTSLTHQQQEDLRILAENEPSLIVVRYCNIPADSVSVAEASTRLSMIATAKRTGRIESGGIVADCKPAFIISLRTVRIQESVACQATSLAPRRARRCYRRWLGTGGGQKPHKKPSRGRGWPLEAPPPCPGGLTLPTGCHMQKGGSIFVDV